MTIKVYSFFIPVHHIPVVQ